MGGLVEDEMRRLRRGMGGKPLDRGEAKDFLYSTFNTLFDLLDHIAAMRDSMQRMEIYLLAMMLIISALALLGLLGGLGYVCSLLNRGPEEKTIVLSSAAGDHTLDTRSPATQPRTFMTSGLPPPKPV